MSEELFDDVEQSEYAEEMDQIQIGRASCRERVLAGV